MTNIKLSFFSPAIPANIFHFYYECVSHVVSYMDANNLNKENVILFVDETDVKNNRTFAPTDYFFRAIKEFVSDIKILNKNENVKIEIIDVKKYSNNIAVVGNILRNKIESLDIYKNNTKNPDDIIYVKRRNSLPRGVTNEQELIDELKKEYGDKVKSVYFEDFNFEEQVKISRNCKLLIGAHGAGLANMWWMNPGTRVQELFPESWISSAFSNISKVKKINYDYMHGKDVVSPGITLDEYLNYLKQGTFNRTEWQDIKRKVQEKKFQVDKDKFMEKIKYQ